MPGLADPRHCGTLLFYRGCHGFLFQCLSPSPPPLGRRRFMFSWAFIRGSHFNQCVPITSGSVRVACHNLTCGGGIFFWLRHKKSPDLLRRLVFFSPRPEHPSFAATRLSGVKQLIQPHCLWTHEAKKKAPTDMKATGKHKENRSRQARQSSYHYRISKAVKAVAIIIGAVIGIALWAIAKPILRGIGWLISILSAIGAIYWLLTL